MVKKNPVIFHEPPTPEQIREARLSLGFTQEQAAELVNASRRTWQNWEADPSSPHYRQMKPALFELFMLKTVGLREKRDLEG